MFALKKKSRLKCDEEEGGAAAMKAEHGKARSKMEQVASMRMLVVVVVLAGVFLIAYFTFVSGNHGCGVIYPCQHRIVDLMSFRDSVWKKQRLLDKAMEEADDEMRFSSNNRVLGDADGDDYDPRRSSGSSGLPPRKAVAAAAESCEQKIHGHETGLANIVFGIAASANLWQTRQEYVKLWWRPGEMRGYVWLDKPVQNWSTAVPPQKISEDTSRFAYANRKGSRAAIRISRVVSETFRLGGMEDVHWFVMGDDDTVFVPENLVKILSKYDHRKPYYIGSHSESHTQNIHFSYNMAYGGGGFAISYPLAKALEKMQDRCIQNYPGLYGSDDRMQACMAELGVPLTKEPGFHQFDIYGDAFGLLAAHPVTPLVSIHHLDLIDPVFPNMTRIDALKHLKKSLRTDPGGTLQQSICYDRWRRWSVSVSWGYAVQVYRDLIPPRTLELPMRTFVSWYRKDDDMAFPFNTRAFDKKKPCDQPAVFFLKDVGYREDGQTSSTYARGKPDGSDPQCRMKYQQHSPVALEEIRVFKEEAGESWHLAPRRQCCRVLKTKKDYLEVSVGDCEAGETII